MDELLHRCTFLVAVLWPIVSFSVPNAPMFEIAVVYAAVLLGNKWLAAARIEPSFTARAWRVFRMSARTQGGLMRAFLGWMSVVLGMLIVHVGFEFVFIYWDVLAVFLVYLFFLNRPPFVLVLGSSASSAEFVQSVRAVARPHRPVSMLKTDWLDRWLREDYSARTPSTYDWRYTVERYVDLVCVVVVDGRSPTPALTDELRWLASSNHLHKVIIVTHDDGRAPALQTAFADLPAEPSLRGSLNVRRKHLDALLLYLIQRPGRIPDPHLPIRTIAMCAGEFE